MYAAEIERLLRDCQVRNLRVVFDVLHPDGKSVRVELTMPEGGLLFSSGRKFPGVFIEDVWSVPGQLVLRLDLLPKPTLERGREAVIRILRDTGEEAKG